MSAGNVKRERIQKIKREKAERGEAVDEGEIAENLPEQEVGEAPLTAQAQTLLVLPFATLKSCLEGSHCGSHAPG